MSDGKRIKIYLIAGEASGDLLGAHLMRSLKKQSPLPIDFYGIGGEKMEAEGLESLFPYYQLSMMGFIEILPFIFNLMARISSTVDDIRAKAPDMVITIDSPGFCFRVVEKLRKESFKAKFVHYVAPSVWAYKPERAEKCARLFDHLLCLLPFEPAYFEKVGLKASWIGHPAVAETATGTGPAFREKYQIAQETTLFTLLPGSRKGEIERHMPIFAKAIGLMAAQIPDLAMAVAVPKNTMPFVMPFFKDCPFRAILIAGEEDKKNAMAACNLALVKSGTVALEVAKAGVPMLVAYRVNPISAWFFRRMNLTKYVNLVNILQKKEVIPELLQELCTPFFLANAAMALLANPEQQTQQEKEAAAALQQLIPADLLPSDKAAQIILQMVS